MCALINDKVDFHYSPACWPCQPNDANPLGVYQQQIVNFDSVIISRIDHPAIHPLDISMHGTNVWFYCLHAASTSVAGR